MPIDFNPQVYNVQPQIVKQQVAINRQMPNDIFVKSVNPLY